MSPITVCDSTLRDGSHAKAHQITITEARAVAGALDRAGVPVIEVSHGDGLGGSSFNYGFSATDEFALIQGVHEELTQARLGVLLLPGIGVKDDISRATDLGVTVARIATHCTEADIAPQHIALARERGMTVVGFLMMAHMNSPDGLAVQATIMADAGAHVVYVTDSAGALLPEGTTERIAALRASLPPEVAVGMHAHNNLSLGVANSLAAIDAGATWIDGCACGMGAGAGNTPLEVLVAVCDRAGIETGIDPFAVMDAAEDVVRPIIPKTPVIDRSSLLLGYAGVYSSFLLHAERASERFGVPASEVLVEVGRRQAVGGQEDLIIDIAAELARRRRPNAVDDGG